MNTTLLDQMIDPLAACLTREAAQKISELRADAVLQARIDDLADKANRGVLTVDESAEYDRYLAAYHLITLFQIKARRLLAT